MNDFRFNPIQDQSGDTLDRDLVISRVIDARAGDAEWATLRQLATRDDSVWDDLAAARRDAGLLSAAMEPVTAAADRTPMPRLKVSRGGGRIGGSFSFSRSLGWAVAAAMGVVALVQFNTNRLTTGIEHARPNLGGLSTRSADQALADYLEIGKQQGRVISEMPERIVLESRPNPSGEGYEVLYVRQLIERAVVQDLFRIGVNEVGKKVYVPASAPVVPSPAE